MNQDQFYFSFYNDGSTGPMFGYIGATGCFGAIEYPPKIINILGIDYLIENNKIKKSIK